MPTIHLTIRGEARTTPMKLHPELCVPGLEADSQLKSVCMVVSSPLTLKFFLIDHIAALSQVYRVVCIANCGDPAWLRQRGLEAPLLDVRIERSPSLIHDLQALWTLLRYFQKSRFDVVHSVTPKAGLLAMTAAALARVPVRIHMFTGQVWANRSGLQRTILKAMDTWLAAMATHILVDSESQRAFLMREGVVKARKSQVLGHGSLNGVDIERFRPNKEVRAEMRSLHNVPASSVAFLYLGRLKRDKGVLDLALAFSQLTRTHEEAYLLILGPDEDHIETHIRQACSDCISRLRINGYTDNPERWLAACDVLCLPSYREGFGSAIIDAASAGVPALGSRIYGITDAIDEGVTGLLHNPGDVKELASKMQILAQDEKLRISLGRAARERAHRYFAKEAATAALLEFYAQTLSATGPKL
jgi:glycosyltransferase involved in cell wall biosynthesis